MFLKTWITTSLASKLAQSEYLPVPSAEVIADSIDVVEVANFLKPDDIAAHSI